MAWEPEVGFKLAYADTFEALYEQFVTYTRDAMYFKGNVRGTSQSFENVGNGRAMPLLTRNSDTEYMSTPQQKRWAVLVPYTANEIIDQEDEMRSITNPESAFTRSLAGSLAREIDIQAFAAAIGSASVGLNERTLGTPVPLPAAQIDTTPGRFSFAKSKLAIKALNKARAWKTERCIFITAEQLDDVLGEEQMTSRDYNTVRVLMEGEIATYLGMTWKTTEELPMNAAGTRRMVITWQKMAMGMAEGLTEHDMERSILKNQALILYNKMNFGMVRIQDNGVFANECDES